MELEVLYADETRMRVAIRDIDTLPQDDVLFIVLHAEDPDSPTGRIRVSQIQGYDNYAVMRRRIGGSWWFSLIGWDDNDYVWHRFDSPLSPAARRVDTMPPLAFAARVFFGREVTPAQWEDIMGRNDPLMR